jgi:hypothetical protein
MTDKTIITMPNGSKWLPSTSTDIVHCVNCSNAVDTPEEIASYPDGNCPMRFFVDWRRKKKYNY